MIWIPKSKKFKKIQKNSKKFKGMKKKFKGRKVAKVTKSDFDVMEA